MVGLLVLALPLEAQEKPSRVAEWLKKPILDAETGLNEVKKYAAGRVLPMPEVASVEEWERHANRMRQETLERVVYRGEAANWRDAEGSVVWFDTIEGGPGYRIRKLRYEALPGLWIPALLYEPETLEGKVPVVMNVNGHDGKGKAADYKQLRCINQAKRGMLALNVEWLGMGQLRTEHFVHYKMNQLDLCGTSGLAPFYLSMKRGLDLLLAHPHADAERVAVAGLSGGGWQTIIISALDTRVTLSNPVAGYSSFITRAGNFSDLGDSEQTPVDLATAADYAQLTALRAPRPTLLTFNAKDNCCFRADHALPPLLDAAGPIYKLYGREQNLRSHVNEDPGDHNFGLDNRQALYRMLGDHFCAGDKTFDAREIPSDEEVKTSEQLMVPLPEENADFNKLALALASELPRNGKLPADKGAAEKYRTDRRATLARVVKASHLAVEATATGMEESEGTTAVFWKIRIGNDWTVPVTELFRNGAAESEIVIAESGRASVADEVETLLATGKRVYAVDPFYYGESKISARDFLFGLLLSAIGDRPLGLQASQVSAIARWIGSQHKGEAVGITAIGPRASLVGLTAAALEPQAVRSATLSGSYGSLKEVIEQNRGVNEAPELFCFGLLEEFDILQLAAVVAPRPVTFVNSTERVTRELGPLGALYQSLGVDHRPLP